MPRLIGEPVSLKPSRGRAKKVKELPRLEMVWPSQKRPKSPDSSQFRRPLAWAVMAAFWRAGPAPARPLGAFDVLPARGRATGRSAARRGPRSPPAVPLVLADHAESAPHRPHSLPGHSLELERLRLLDLPCGHGAPPRIRDTSR